MIAPMTSDHVAEVVRIHSTCLSEDFLTALGPEFLRVFYLELLDPNIGFGYVWLDDIRVAAYVSGTYEASGFTRRVIRKHGWVLVRALRTNLLRKPGVVVQALGTAAYLLRPSAGMAGPQIRANAVLPEFRSHGIGRKLYVEGLRHLRNQGAEYCTVMVSALDPVVNHLWESMGGRIEASFSLNGTQRNLYRVPLREGSPTCSVPLTR